MVEKIQPSGLYQAGRGLRANVKPELCAGVCHCALADITRIKMDRCRFIVDA